MCRNNSYIEGEEGTLISLGWRKVIDKDRWISMAIPGIASSSALPVLIGWTSNLLDNNFFS